MNIFPSDEACFHPNGGLGQKINPKVSRGSNWPLGARAGREMLWDKGAGGWHGAACFRGVARVWRCTRATR